MSERTDAHSGTASPTTVTGPDQRPWDCPAWCDHDHTGGDRNHSRAIGELDLPGAAHFVTIVRSERDDCDRILITTIDRSGPESGRLLHVFVDWTGAEDLAKLLTVLGQPGLAALVTEAKDVRASMRAERQAARAEASSGEVTS